MKKWREKRENGQTQRGNQGDDDDDDNGEEGGVGNEKHGKNHFRLIVLPICTRLRPCRKSCMVTLMRFIPLA